MRRVFQRYCNDCVVAAVAMATGLAYRRVLAAAKANGFKPGVEGEGLFIAAVLTWVGFTYSETTDIEDVQRHGPDIYIFPAPDGSEDYHCAVIYKADLYDPSKCSGLKTSYVIWNSSHRYSDIKPI